MAVPPSGSTASGALRNPPKVPKTRCMAPDHEEPDDAALLAAPRAGDAEAYGRLYRRHVDAARRLAGQLAEDPGAAEDLVSEAFAKVLAALQRGGGPDTAFRAYLNTALRNTFYTGRHRDRRLEFTDDLTRYEMVVWLPDPAVAEQERRSAVWAVAPPPPRSRGGRLPTPPQGGGPAHLAAPPPAPPRGP